MIQHEVIGKERDVTQVVFGQNTFDVEIQPVAQDGDGDVVFAALLHKSGEMRIDLLRPGETIQFLFGGPDERTFGFETRPRRNLPPNPPLHRLPPGAIRERPKEQIAHIVYRYGAIEITKDSFLQLRRSFSSSGNR